MHKARFINRLRCQMMETNGAPTRCYTSIYAIDIPVRFSCFVHEIGLELLNIMVAAIVPSSDSFSRVCYRICFWSRIFRTSYVNTTAADFLVVCMGLLSDTRKCRLRMRLECWESFPRHRLERRPLVSDPGMHFRTCFTHVWWCMSGSLTRGEGKSYIYFRRMCSPQFCASGNSSMASTSVTIVLIMCDKWDLVFFSSDTLNCGCACAGNAGKVFPSTDFKGDR